MIQALAKLVMRSPLFLRFLALLLGLAPQAICRAESFDAIEIVGTARFRDRVHEALALLKMKDASAFEIVTAYVKRIEEGKHSGMWAYKEPPTYQMSDATAYHSVTWCAATIAHDSYHSKLYHDYKKSHAGLVPDEIWTGRSAEQQCMKHQLAVMEHIGASKPEIDWAKRQADGHYVKDKEAWQDHEKHNW
jgi:hypothetical protein